MYELGPVRLPVDWEPLNGLVPDQEPEAVQEVVFVELQVKVDDPPEEIEVGLAERLTVGGGVSLRSTVTVLPPIAEQISPPG